MKNKRLTIIIFIVHIFLIFVPNLFISHKYASYVAFYTLLWPIHIMDTLGLPVTGEVAEHMFMAPIKILGWSLMLLFWVLVYYSLYKSLKYIAK